MPAPLEVEHGVSVHVSKASPDSKTKSSSAKKAPEKDPWVRLVVTIQDVDTQAEITCKSDGLRFNGSDTTAKLRNGAQYRFVVTSEPAISLGAPEASITSRNVECTEPAANCCCFGSGRVNEYEDLSKTEWSDGIKVALNGQDASSAGGSRGGVTKSHTDFTWTCDLPTTETGLRTELNTEILVQDYGTLNLPLVCKVYANQDAGAKHGVALRSVCYAFRRHPFTREVELKKMDCTKAA